MKHYTVDPALGRLYRNPVLTAMMVTSLIFGVTASAAGIALWRASSACMLAEANDGPDDSPGTTDVAPRGELLIHRNAQADLEARIERVEQRQSDSARPHRVVPAACPCAAPTEWHWRI